MDWYDKQVKMMGTTIDIKINHSEGQILLEEVVEKLKEYEFRFSANDDKSELMAVNLAAGKEWVTVHPQLFELIKQGKEHSLPTDSFLNIAIGPLTKAWRIGFKDAQVPNEKDIQILLKQINPRRIHLKEETTSIFLEEGMSIDLGALAKGYIADLIIAELKTKGVKAGLINLGGNIVTFGSPPNKNRSKWLIGIRQPTGKRDENAVVLKVKDKSVVTSGIYERVLEMNEKKYHHIFDSNSGYPVNSSVLSVTIISDLSVDGEIWTTRLFGHTPEEIIQKIDQLDAIEGIVMTKEKILFSKGMKNYI